jgi:hypothetical protein
VIVRLTALDGKLPNLALMKLSAWHKSQGDEVIFTSLPERDLFEPSYDRVYGSAIFKFSAPTVERFRSEFPDAIVGGTGTDDKRTVEEIIGSEYEHYDYSIRPDYAFSLGFTQRGCRLKCGFCVVPRKEGAPRSVNRIADIWRGEGHQKKVCLLDNDFFGQPKEEWRARIAELRSGKFKVCFNQGLNVRLIDEEACAALSTINYMDDQFTTRRLYTAWDNLKDEGIFMRGVDMLEAAGVPPKHLMAYMLIGYDPSETWERIWHRFRRMVDRGISPYPMVFDRKRTDLLCFQRWVLTGIYRFVPWNEYKRQTKTPESMEGWRKVYGAGMLL